MVSRVADEEVLYRLVKHQRGYIKLENGEWRPSSQAFTDPKYRISVDRAELCNHDPAHTLRGMAGFVCSVGAGKARGIKDVVQRTPKGEIIRQHSVCVDHAPEPENYAHAEVYAHPTVANKNVFRKLQERLALLAQWEEGFDPSGAENS